jgi:hypothetical protein
MREINMYHISVGKPEGMRQIGRPREDNIRMDVRERAVVAQSV